MVINKVVLCFFVLFSTLAIQGNQLHAVTNPHIERGNIHAKSGNYKESLSALNSAIQADPRNARAYKLRGHVYYAMGDYAKALTDLDRVVSLVPDSANALADRAIVYSVSGKHGLALADIERALAMKPSSAFAKAVRKEILERAK